MSACAMTVRGTGHGAHNAPIEGCFARTLAPSERADRGATNAYAVVCPHDPAVRVNGVPT